ncbi:MAG TPA: hypothetical protein VG963_32335 [Polyangiaceae bacterium]|nr:hypothetical protein [Polyangiaceae bacterium]
MTSTQLDAWLTADPAEADTKPDTAELAPPPPAPRRRGVVIEGGLGALGHLGDMKHVSPISPSFRLQAGYEIFNWLLLSAQGDLELSDTAYAHRPPDKRAYALFGFGIGARLGWQPWHVVGFHFQPEGGLSSVTDDVLSTYGYRDATRLRPFVGATIGVDWFQINPHYALGIYGGVRDYLQTFERTYGSAPPLAWVSGVALRYAL